MTTTKGNIRENHVVEFGEGRRIAWEPGQERPGHLWRWELDELDSSPTRVTPTYDWTDLTDEKPYLAPEQPRPRTSRHPCGDAL
jgi:hypothetical protein